MAAKMDISNASTVDEELYSRQLYVFGHEAQRKLATASVLIIGLNGLGAEAAKNIILAGVRSVTLVDDTPTKFEDLSAQFYLDESSIGQPRAHVSVSKLAELNPYVQVSVLSGELSEQVLKTFTVVVLIGQSLDFQISTADFCHANNIAVVVGDVRGVFGCVFCDFGESFIVHDNNGEPAASSMVAAISQDSPALVTVLEETRHNLETGDVVVISELEGMEGLNDQEFNVTVKDSYSFEINADTRSFNEYRRGGYVNQVKQPTVVSFKRMSESIEQPGSFAGDFMKDDRCAPLHVAFRAIHQFVSTHGDLPTPGDAAHAQALFDFALAMNAAAPEDEHHFKIPESQLRQFEDLIKRLALCSRGQVGSIAAMLGGILGQEVLKVCSGKFMPIRQWLYMDCAESLPDEPLPANEVAPVGSRYDGQIMVFGRSIQERLASQNMFLVGAGAIGCEMLKNWAMMGVSCGAGTTYVTDMDQIERSNLSRQFLFRNTDIGQLKSTSAARAATRMNPAFRTIAYDSKVAPETEGFFNDDFFEGLDCVCAALDNVEARLYLDQRCLFYHKPMLESGTLGAKGHTQVVVPHKTEHYGASRDPPEKTIPICTLKTFPSQIEHTLQWAKEWFEEVYKQTPVDVNRYIENTDFEASLAAQQNMKLDTLTRVKEALTGSRPQNTEECIVWARIRFEDLFSNNIKQLLYNIPLDKVTSTGALFWSGAKKPPAPIEFDPTDPLHLEFITASANLRASVYGLPPCSDPSVVASVAVQVVVPLFRPAQDSSIPLTEEEAKEKAAQAVSAASMDIDVQCSDLLQSIPAPETLRPLQLRLVDFDKDIDDHMRVVAACSNLRARNYRIHEADLHKSRGIAGKIMPAIATTTALVSGLVCMEIFKLLQDMPMERFKSTFTNLAIPLFSGSEPNPPKSTTTTVKGAPWKWTPWDRIDITTPELTLDGLIALLEEQYGAELTMLSSGVTILYSNFMNKAKAKERKGMNIKAIVESVTKKVLPAEQKYLILELILTDLESDEELEIPYLRFKLF